MSVETSDANQQYQQYTWLFMTDQTASRRIDAKVNGLDFSTVGLLYFFMFITLENVSEKKMSLPLEERFYSKSISVDLWYIGLQAMFCLSVIDHKQANNDKPIQIHDLSMFYLLWFWRSQSLHLVFSSKFLLYLSRKQMSLPHEQLYFNDQRYHNYRTFSYNRNELS